MENESKHRPTSVWILILALIICTIFITYIILLSMESSSIHSDYKTSDDTAAGLFFSWGLAALTNGISFLTSLLIIPLVGILGMLVVALVNLILRRESSRILVNIFAGMLFILSFLLISCAVVDIALFIILVAIILLYTANSSETRRYLEN